MAGPLGRRSIDMEMEVSNMTKTARRLIVSAVLFFGAVFTLAAVSEPDGGSGTRRPPSYSGTYDHDQLQRDAQMTQNMSTPNANTDAQYHRNDEQLTHSSDPAFVRDLEAHQADVDRMLARPGR
jgi:hypothetical protein